jgi:hypothetical protein
MTTIYQDRFNDINEASAKYDESISHYNVPVVNPYDKTEVVLTTKENIQAYFKWLGEHLADSQDVIYVNLQVDDLGIHKMQIDFARIG